MVFLLWDLWALALWTDRWWDFVLVWLAARTGVVTRAAAGSTTASVAIRRLNERVTSGNSGMKEDGDWMLAGAEYWP